MKKIDQLANSAYQDGENDKKANETKELFAKYLGVAPEKHVLKQIAAQLGELNEILEVEFSWISLNE